MAFIRPYKPSDEEAVLHIFRETASPNLRAATDPEVLHVGSFLWLRPYVKLSPEFCSVLDDGSGTAVGYVLGVPDTVAFVKTWRDEFLATVKDAGIEEPSEDVVRTDIASKLKWEVYTPEHLLHATHPNLVQKYPAHLHIDILTSHQRQGWGRKLLDTLFRKLEDVKPSGSDYGIHLGMSAENWEAGKFYDTIGFKKFDEMMESGEPGRKGDAFYLVKSI